MTTKPNPFTAKAKKAKLRPFGSSSRTTGSSSRRRSSTSSSTYAWVKPGMKLRIEWSYDRAYGPGRAKFSGEVVKIDDWLTLMSSAGVKFHGPLSMLDKVERV